MADFDDSYTRTEGNHIYPFHSNFFRSFIQYEDV